MTEKLKHKKCCLCGNDIDFQRDEKGKIFWTDGHNAEPLKDGRCCSVCNETKVIPERIKHMCGD